MNPILIPINNFLDRIKVLVFGQNGDPRNWLFGEIDNILTRRQKENVK